ncbi:RICIN domain-containing protein [Streptosporangium sp. NPDC000239]|uniref:RICIN domain-containing protein n=1 Tax=Streptosporangium sp. NPDC000239 TaxID=3154248 RepID=UPI003323C25B
MKATISTVRIAAGLCALAVSGAIPVVAPAASAATSVPAPLFRAKLMVNHSGKCLDVPGANQAAGQPVQQWHCYDAPDNQTWNLVAAYNSDLADGFVADNYYTIRAQHSGKCLEVQGGATTDQASVIQQACDTTYRTTQQQWKLVQRPNGYFSLVARHSGKCLTVPRGNLTDGVLVVQQDCSNDLPYQEWKLL